MHPSPQSADSILKTASCRLCGGNLRTVIDFGPMPLANAFLKKEEFASEFFFNLAAGFCGTCALFQLNEQPKPELMFHEQYPFFTGTSQGMRHHFEELAGLVKREFIPDGGLIVEIGSNDGTFLKHFPKDKYTRLGIEPSSNTAAEAQAQGIESETSFFNLTLAQQIKSQKGGADIIAGANVLCHIPDFSGTLAGIRSLLKEDGVGIFEDPYLGAMLDKTSYDQIYDEHVFLFSATALQRAADKHGLRLFDTQPIWTHGGSLRYFLCRKESKRPESARVSESIEKEKRAGMLDFSCYEKFRERCEHSRDLLKETLTALHAQKKRVAGYAATSKSTTVLNYCGIGSDLVEFICDTTPEKQEKYTPGAHIPVFPYEKFKENYPSHALLFAWNHSEEIMAKETAFMNAGGRWLTYVPEVRIL